MDFFKDLRRFFVASGVLGVGLMTGGIVAYGMALYEHTSGKSLSASLWVGLGILLFSLGSFLAWRGEEKSRVEAQSKLLHLTVPNLVLGINEMWVSFDPEYNFTNVLISASVINQGATSPALGWHLRFQTPTLHMTTVHCCLPDAENTWRISANRALVLRTEKMLDAITAEAVPAGECKTGRLFFQLMGDITGDLLGRHCQIYIGTTDRLGVSVWQQLPESAKGGSPLSLPGETFITFNSDPLKFLLPE